MPANKPSLINKVRSAMQSFLGSTTPDGMLQTSRFAQLSHEHWADVARGLTPRKLSQILCAADNGDIVAQHQLFSDVEDQDEHIFTELSKRRRSLLTLDWSILPAVQKEKQMQLRAEAIAEEVRALFDTIPDYEDFILHLADAIGHGFVALELEWGFDGKNHVPLAIHHRPQHWFCLDRNTQELLLRSDKSQEGVVLSPLGWIVHQHRSKAGWFARHGLFRVLMGTFLYKQYARAGFAEFLEIHGLPLRVGKFPSWASEQEKNALLNGLMRLGRDAAAVIPESMQLEFHEAVKASEAPYTAMIDYCERGQSKAILGGTLTTQADGKSSTNALGKVHNEVRRDILVSDAVQIAQTITRSLLLPLATLNCDLDDIRLAPWFRFDTAAPADLLLMAEALPKLAPVMPIPAAWAYEKCRIPMPQEDEPVL